MKTYAKFLNAIDKVPTTTFQEKHTKEEGIQAMIKIIKEQFPQAVVKYIPSKGFTVSND